MSEHEHEWRTVYEQGIVGGNYVVAFECRICLKWVEESKVDPISGIGGKLIEKEAVLVGINGGCGNCSDGSVYKRQIMHENGVLEIVRP
jgi:hypothetical protein